jgi:hypothetical protein
VRDEPLRYGIGVRCRWRGSVDLTKRGRPWARAGSRTGIVVEAAVEAELSDGDGNAGRRYT